MTAYDYDLFVIGAGSGGVRAARVAAQHGARVGIAEEYRYGGTCVIRGCVPKKLLVFGSHYRDDFEDAAHYGWTVTGASFDWPTMIANKDREIDRLNGIYINLLDKVGVQMFDGRARVTGPNEVQVAGETKTAGVILIATGGRPWKPTIPGADLGITSNEAFHLPALGQRVCVVGGGYIGVEFASIFHGFGCQVTHLYRNTRLLRGFDEDLRDHIQDNLRAGGVDLRLRMNAESLARAEGGIAVTLTDGEVIEVDHVLFATGRVPNTDDLGLDSAGVALTDGGAVKVDEYSRTNVPSIYAVGDVTDRMQLTPVALHEGHAFADSVFGNLPRPVDHDNVPTAIFTQPPAATVGLTEAAAKAALSDVHIYESTFRQLKHTLTNRAHRTYMKLVIDGATDRVVGAHMVGEHAAEIMQCLAICVKLGATKADFDRTIGIHPTAAEELVTMRQRSR